MVKEEWIRNEDIRMVYIKGGEYWSEFGVILMKDDKPYIFSIIPGDYYSAYVFNNSFVVSGHDGNYMFNINNPTEHHSSTR